LSDAFAARPDPDAVPVASIAVAVDFARGHRGVASAAQHPVPSCVDQQTVAAMVALRLVADDRLDLDADVNQLLTSWRCPGTPAP
jgi:hypothetical protein